MDELVTVMTFSFAPQLAIIRGRLESEGIECFTKDELTVQANPFYSNAVGGIKLQVRKDDVVKAVEILKEEGYITDKDIAPPQLYFQLDKLTSGIPLLNKVRWEIRFIIIIVVLVLITIGAIYYATLPSNYDVLTKRTWCVDHITYDGKDYQPHSTGYRIIWSNDCREQIDFMKEGIINLPGFNSSEISGYWKFMGRKLQVWEADSFKNVYNGIYDVDISDRQLILKSEKTTIYCHSRNIND